MASQSQSNDHIPTIPLYSPTDLRDAHIRARFRRGIFGGVEPELSVEGGLAPWYLPSRSSRKAAWPTSLVDTLDALYDMDLRHDIPIMAVLGPIDCYTEDDNDPSNAKVFTFISRSVRQSRAPAAKRIVAQATEDFLNGIVKDHVKFRRHRVQDYMGHEDKYQAAASARSQQGEREDSGPWNPDSHKYQERLQQMSIRGTLLTDIDPVSPVFTNSNRGGSQSHILFTPPSSPPSHIPTPAHVGTTDSDAALSQHFGTLTLTASTPRATGTGSGVDHTEWGVPQVPHAFRISPTLDFVLAANGVETSKIAMVKCILADGQCRGHDCIEQLERVVDYGLARTIGYLAGRLTSCT